MARYSSCKHADNDIVKWLVHVDGGGPRLHKDRMLPATWAVVLTSVASDGSRAFYAYGCGRVQTDPSGHDFLGAEVANSMTAETTAQAFAAMFLLSLCGDLRKLPVGVEMVYYNETAARLSRAVPMTKESKNLAAVNDVLWQLVAQRTKVDFYHTYSHCGEVLNELADNLVANAAFNPEVCESMHVTPARWARDFDIHVIKLLYLLDLPEDLRLQYPEIDADKTSIMRSRACDVRRGLEADVFAEEVDHPPQHTGVGKLWTPCSVCALQYNPLFYWQCSRQRVDPSAV